MNIPIKDVTVGQRKWRGGVRSIYYSGADNRWHGKALWRTSGGMELLPVVSDSLEGLPLAAVAALNAL